MGILARRRVAAKKRAATIKPTQRVSNAVEKNEVEPETQPVKPEAKQGKKHGAK